MIESKRFYVLLLCTGLMAAYLPTSMAEGAADNIELADTVNAIQSQPKCTYKQKINEKALRAVSNFDSSLLEIPKSIINTTNESNIIYGLIGGVIEGTLNTAGRIGTSLADLLSLPIPTKPIAYPQNVWDDFDATTTYGDTFRLDECPPNDMVVATPEIPVVKPPAAVTVPPRQGLDNVGYSKDLTNRKLDTLFKKQMMK